MLTKAPILAALCYFVFTTVLAAQAQDAGKPNIIIILADDLAEQHDLADKEPGKAQQLLKELNAFIQQRTPK